MSQIVVRFGGRLVQVGFLIISLCVGFPGLAPSQSGSPGASIASADQAKAIPETGAQTTANETPGGKSKKSSFILTEVEPLLLLLFGSILFIVATGIKLKLSRVNRASSR
jgi:hypothetical protein